MSTPSKTLIILVGPSGVGKSSFIERALKEMPDLRDIITYSTRKPRAGEKEGDPYHFVSKEEFEKKIGEGFFVEWANVHGQLYGTPWDQIRQTWKDGRVVIMDVDVQGARHFQKEFPQACTIFLAPPSMDSLRQRIEKRGVAADIEVRLQTAAREMAAAKEFTHHLVNDDFETSFRHFRFLIEKLLKNQ